MTDVIIVKETKINVVEVGIKTSANSTGSTFALGNRLDETVVIDGGDHEIQEIIYDGGTR